MPLTHDQLAKWLRRKVAERDDKTCDDSQLKAVLGFLDDLRCSIDPQGSPVDEAQVICASLDQLCEHAHWIVQDLKILIKENEK